MTPAKDANLPDIIAAIRAAEAKATPGPVEVGNFTGIYSYITGAERCLASTHYHGVSHQEAEAFATLIALSRNHILALCDAAEELGQLKKDLAALDALFQKVLEGRDSARAERDALRAEVEAVRSYLSDPGGKPFHDGDSLLEQVQSMHRQMQQERKALEAEVEALKAQLATVTRERNQMVGFREAWEHCNSERNAMRQKLGVTEGAPKTWEVLFNELEAAKAEAEALRKDRARLDWLEHYLSDDAKNLSQPTASDPTWQFGYNPGPAYHIDGGGDSLREAIDEAMP